MHFKFRVFLVLAVIMLNASMLWAQTPPPGGGSSVGAPLDTLSGVLLLASITYAGKRISKRRID